MINMEHLANVKERIIEIQDRVNSLRYTPLKSADFASQLEREIANLKKSAAPTAPADKKDSGKTESTGRTKVTLDDLRTLEAKESAVRATNPLESGNSEEISAQESKGASVAGLIASAAEKFGVDSKLVDAVAQVESGKNQKAVSGAGAVGVMQLMPSTAASLGVDPYDMAQNIEGGAKYLRGLLDRFGGDVKKAVAAYNAGPNAVKKYGGVPPYKETQNYVKQVLDLYR